MDLVLRRGVPGDVYNIGGCNEMRNLDLVEMLVHKLGKSRDLITFVKDRPGHDLRYAIDAYRPERNASTNSTSPGPSPCAPHART